jgi:hypothetical protein
MAKPATAKAKSATAKNPAKAKKPTKAMEPTKAANKPTKVPAKAKKLATVNPTNATATPPSLSEPPTPAELERAYAYLQATGTFRSSCEGQAFFYEACWSNDAELEGAFEDWAATQDNLRNLPMDLLEEEYVHRGKFAELHGLFAHVAPDDVPRAVAMMRGFLAAPKRVADRYDQIQE